MTLPRFEAMAWKITSTNRSEKSATNRWGIVGRASRHRRVQARSHATDRSRARERMRTHNEGALHEEAAVLVKP